MVVTNSDTQSGSLNNGYTYATSTGGAPIAFVQVKAATPQAASASVAVTYTAAQTAGNLNVLLVGWNDTTSTVSSVTDSRGNTYALAIGPTSGTGLRQSIYYAKNIAAGSNTVTVKFNQAAAFVDIRALEYSGLDPASPLDVTAGAAGSGTSANSGAATTTSAKELIVGAGMTASRFTQAGTGFTLRTITSPDSDIAEDKITTAAGSYNATAPNSPVVRGSCRSPPSAPRLRKKQGPRQAFSEPRFVTRDRVASPSGRREGPGCGACRRPGGRAAEEAAFVWARNPVFDRRPRTKWRCFACAFSDCSGTPRASTHVLIGGLLRTKLEAPK